MSAQGDSRLCLGAISGAHGVRGEVRIKTFTENPLDIGSYGPVSTEDGARRFELRKLRDANGHVVAALKGVTTREAATALKGTRLFVDRSRLPDLDEEDTWYHADLIGLTALSEDGARIGEIKAVFDFGAGDLLDVALEGTSKTVLIPFTEETVPAVDIKAGTLTMVPPEGLIEDED